MYRRHLFFRFFRTCSSFFVEVFLTGVVWCVVYRFQASENAKTILTGSRQTVSSFGRS